MLFNSQVFFLFLPLFLILYFSTRGNTRIGICLIGSYIFYGWWDWRFLFLIISITLVNYFAGLWIVKYDSPDKKKVRKLLLWISVVSCFSALGFFKYFNFFTENTTILLNTLGFHADTVTLKIILPVGISFYTFQAMSYTIDLYRGNLKVERSLLRFATYIAFFPQLVAGPIVRARTFLPQLVSDRQLSWDNLRNGANMMLWGYFLKCGLADSLAQVVDARFAAPVTFSSLDLLLGVIFYAFQIYGDFAGYSLIAIGCARIMGYDFGVNFDRPYFSSNFSEFWRRWHISLSTWFRDYLYIPLGGNRGTKFGTSWNRMLTMLLAGLWHGAAWRFIIWGGLHGFYLITQRALQPKWTQLTKKLSIPPRLLLPFCIIFVFSLTCFAWIFFRADSFETALIIIRRIVAMDNMSFAAIKNKFWIIKGAFLIAIVIISEGTSFAVSRQKHSSILLAFKAAALLWLIALFGTFEANSFIYFQF